LNCKMNFEKYRKGHTRMLTALLVLLVLSVGVLGALFVNYNRFVNNQTDGYNQQKDEQPLQQQQTMHNISQTQQNQKTHNVTLTQQNQTKDPYLNLLQIGANDGVTGNNNDVMNILKNPQSKAILVEGSPSVFKLLTKTVKDNYDKSLNRIVPFSALICEEGTKMLFYSLDTEKLKKASNSSNLPHWVEYQLASLKKDSILSGLDFYLKSAIQRGHFEQNTNAEDYIVEEYMDCVSFETILANSPMRIEEVQVLAIDVEGYDANVMLESFKVPELQPNLIIFEFKSAVKLFPKEFNRVIETLHNRGYSSNCRKFIRTIDAENKSDWKCGPGQDVYAYKNNEHR